MSPKTPSGKVPKTLTIKQRRIEVYLPSLKTKEEWTAEARRRGLSISEMVFLLVHETFTGADKDAPERARRLETENDALHSQLDDLRRQIESLEAQRNRMEHDLAEYRAQAFLGAKLPRTIDPRLHKILSEAKDRAGKHRVVTDVELKRALRIGPKDETQAKALLEELGHMETHNWVTKTGGGWFWNAKKDRR